MIKKLPESIISRIAAGEIITSPYNIIKECLENSIDSGASRIKISLSSTLLSLKIVDNGCGICRGDFEKVCLKHYTSKTSSLDDIYRCGTIKSFSSFGFRGEALHSISVCSDVKILSNSESGRGYGYRAVYEFGEMIEISKVPMDKTGTEIEIRNIFERNLLLKEEFYKNKRECIRCINLVRSYGCIYNAIEMDLDSKMVVSFDSSERNFLLPENNLKEFICKSVGNVNILKSKLEGKSVGNVNILKSKLEESENENVNILKSKLKESENENENILKIKLEESENENENILKIKLEESENENENENERLVKKFRTKTIEKIDKDTKLKQIIDLIAKNKVKYIINMFLNNIVEESGIEIIYEKNFFAIFTNRLVALRRYVFVLFVNNRLVCNEALKRKILHKYKNVIKKDKYPLVYIEIFVDYADVNVHPSKREVLIGSRVIYDEIADKISARISICDYLHVNSIGMIIPKNIKYETNDNNNDINNISINNDSYITKYNKIDQSKGDIKIYSSIGSSDLSYFDIKQVSKPDNGNTSVYLNKCINSNDSASTIKDVNNVISFTDIKNDFTDIKNDFTDVKNDFTDIKNDFTDIKNDFTDVKNDFTDVKNVKSSYTNNITDIKNVKSSYINNITDVKNDFTDVKNVKSSYASNVTYTNPNIITYSYLDNKVQTPSIITNLTAVNSKNVANPSIPFLKNLVYIGCTNSYIFAQYQANLIKIDRHDFLFKAFYDAIYTREPVTKEVLPSKINISPKYWELLAAFGIIVSNHRVIRAPIICGIVVSEWSYFSLKLESADKILLQNRNSKQYSFTLFKNMTPEFCEIVRSIADLYKNISMNINIFNSIKKNITDTAGIYKTFKLLVGVKELYKKFGRC